MGKWIGIAVVLLVALMGGLLAASEMGGEVVVLYTAEDGGSMRATSLWIVEDHDQLWLRAGQADSAWAVRLRQNPEVEMERAGERRRYRAVVAPEQRDRINLLMAEDYGWADRLIGLMRSDQGTLAIRLDPRPG